MAGFHCSCRLLVFESPMELKREEENRASYDITVLATLTTIQLFSRINAPQTAASRQVIFKVLRLGSGYFCQSLIGFMENFQSSSLQHFC